MLTVIELESRDAFTYTMSTFKYLKKNLMNVVIFAGESRFNVDLPTFILILMEVIQRFLERSMKVGVRGCPVLFSFIRDHD